MFERNSLSEICSEILAATLPFITVGFLGNSLILYISLTIGIIALLGLGICIILKNKLSAYRLEKIQPQDFSLPYAIALSSAILSNHGIDANIGYWVALGLCVLTIGSLLTDNKDSKK